MSIFPVFPPARGALEDAGLFPVRLGGSAILFGFFLGGAVLLHILDLDEVLSGRWADLYLRGQGAPGILLFVCLTALLSALGFPRQALATLGGYAFGVLYGVLWCSLGLAGGCACGFFYARRLGREALRRRMGKRIRKLDAFLSRRPFLMTMAVRFLPAGCNALTNIAAGLTSVSAPAFLAGSVVGYLPQTAIFSLLGSGARVEPEIRLSLAVLLFLLATFLGWRIYRACAARPVPAGEEEGTAPAS
ncbi:MAG: VTT domain-containing protein [Desulfovibrio sp.]|jgi:uncharacterized membrane protein YdjX (TVP38/TMEM64 family)|nr:VTT domain-containing protein [Desulfovibrio sp.]